jgi:hypothetical protein
VLTIAALSTTCTAEYVQRSTSQMVPNDERLNEGLQNTLTAPVTAAVNLKYARLWLQLYSVLAFAATHGFGSDISAARHRLQ